VVFNSVNWTRSGFVEVDIAEGSALFDATNDREVPQETIQVGRSTPLPGFGGGYRRVRFLAEDVPGLGYKLFAIRPVKNVPQKEEMPASVRGDRTFESPFYRLTIDVEKGSIRSLWDKELKKELVDGKIMRIQAYVYVCSADDIPNNSLYRHGALRPPAHADCRERRKAQRGTSRTVQDCDRFGDISARDAFDSNGDHAARERKAY
jgi:hypothetical protein